MPIIKVFKHQNIDFISIKNGDFEVTLSNLGASIYKIMLNQEIMTLTPKNLDDFVKGFYYGKTIGRIGNRLENGQIKIKDKIYQIDDLNEGNNTLHSGKNGFSNKVFKYDINETNDSVSVIFTYFSKDGEQGLPGNVNVKATYLIKDNGVTLTYDASSDVDTALALVNHTYFSLGEESINNLSLFINADRFIETRSTDLIPLKEKDVLPCLDFRKQKKIIKDIGNEYLTKHKTLGYDHCFILNKNEPSFIISNDRYSLEIKTTYPAIQIYSCNYSDDIDFLTTKLKTRCGLAIEPEESLLSPYIGKVYHREAKYIFKRK